ncbi:unnamed protein product [Trichobilharzia szidati]|nr:unnamed protein product [Trichobilharzia szidati]
MNVKKLIEQRAKTKITKERAELTLMIAAIYSEQGCHDSALVEYKRYLEIWETKEDNLQCAIANRYLAECYIELCDFTQAIIHTNRYLQLSQIIDNKMEQQRAYVTLGRCFLNRVDTLKDGPLVVKSLKSASQALVNSIKLIKDLSPNLDAKSSAEMRAVSLLNLGHVERAQHNHNAALESFTQCITLARKHSLQKILFRAAYQAGEMLMNKVAMHTFQPCSRSVFLKLIKQSGTEKALEIVRSALSSPLAKPYVDNEAKLLCGNLKELLAQIYLCDGNSRKAIKIFRLLKIESPTASKQYTSMMKKGFRLMNLFNEIPNEVSTVHDFIAASRIHEKLGDLYSGIDLQGCALRHYQFMLGFSELAYKQQSIPGVVVPDDIVKLVDAALISIAETYRALTYYDQCVEMYRREILWATSTGLSTSDMVTSWLSLAQAQRLMPNTNTSTIQHTDSSETNQKTTLNGSETVLDSLLSAHKTSKLVGSTSLIGDCLRELLDYYEQYNYTDKAYTIREELKKIDQAACSQAESEKDQGDAEEEEEEEAESDDDDDDTVTQFLESLSSDSELEQCIGNTELIDEFQDGTRSKKSGKAICLKTNMKGETPLHVAAINGDMEHVVKLIEVLGHPVNVPDGAGWLPIHEAAFHDRSEIATYLLDRGARLDDPGYPDDYSTPLFEAVHNGSLTTALIFVNRGANLWHKNKQGEYLPNLLDQWEPTRHASGTFAEQRVKFNELLTAIKNRLGDDYDRWCNLKSEILEVDHSSTESADSPESVKHSSTFRSNRRKSKHYYYSSSLCDINETQSIQSSSSSSNVNRRKSLRGRNWKDLLVDLDEDSQSSPPIINSKKANVDAVESYKAAMKAVGSSKTVSTGKRHSLCDPDTSETRKRKKKSNVVDVDDSDWLVIDEKPTGSRSVSSANVKGHFETLNVKRGKSKSTVSDKNRSQEEVIDFSPHLAFTSTQNENLSTQPTANNRVHSLKSTSTPIKDKKELSQSLHRVIKDSSSSHDKVNSNNNNPVLSGSGDQPIQAAKFPVNECSGASHSIKVAFPDISVLVPVDSLSRSVSWLATEAYRRRQILMGFNNTNTPCIDSSELVRLSTRDRALLLPSDRLYAVIPNLSQSGCIVELLAELNESLGKRTVTSSSSSSTQSNQPVQFPHPVVYSSQLNYEPRMNESPSELLPPSFYRSIIDKARSTGVVDLSHLGMDDSECCKSLGYIVRGGIRVITDIQLQGNSLTTDLLDIENTSTNCFCLNLLGYLSQISSQLVKLNLSMNLFNGQFIKRLLNGLSKQFKENESPRVLMPRLQYLNLSYNPLLGAGGGGGGGGYTDSGFDLMKTFDHHHHQIMNRNSTNYYYYNCCWTGYINDILKAFPKLTYFNLAGCSLGGNSTTTTTENYTDLHGGGSSEKILYNINTDSFVSCLSELDLSWNPHISPSQLVNLFSMNSLKALRCLRLRGCSTPNNVNMLTLNQCPVSLPIDSFELSSFNWLSSNYSSTMLTKDIEKLNNFDKPSSGDELLKALCSALISGEIRLQTLDMGHCQLTYHSLTSLKSLFGTPGSSITTLIIDHNPMLRNVIISDTQPSPAWIRVLQATTQSASALVSLTIDLPQIPENNPDALTTAFTAVESKLLPVLSPTPLQELVIVHYKAIHWTPPNLCIDSNNTIIIIVMLR